MSSLQPSPPPLNCATRQKLLAAAIEIFAQRGYRSCVDDIARQAGVAKQTLYRHFATKDELFSEAVKQMAAEALVSLDVPGGDLRAALLRFASACRAKALGETGLCLHRVLVAESSRLPQLVKTIFTVGFGETVSRITAMIDAAMAEGRLRRDDPHFATDMFFSMVIGMERSRRMFAATEAIDDAEDRAERIVDCFLRAFAPEPLAAD